MTLENKYIVTEMHEVTEAECGCVLDLWPEVEKLF